MDNYSVFKLLCSTFTCLSCACSLLNLLLIWDMGAWSGHIFLITQMTFYQLIYDVSWYPSNIYSVNSISYDISIMMQFWSGLAQTMVCAEIAFSVAFILVFKRSFDVFKKARLLFAISVIPSMVICALYLAYVLSGKRGWAILAGGGYTVIRIISIIALFIIYGYTVILMSKMIPKYGKPSSQVRAMKTLVERMKYYPIVQAVTRIPYTIYQFVYGFQVDPAYANSSEFVLICLIVVITPLVSVGYLAIFLVMQPQAMRHLRTRLTTCKRPVRSPRGTNPLESVSLLAAPIMKEQSDYLDDDDDDLLSDMVLISMLEDEAAAAAQQRDLSYFMDDQSVASTMTSMSRPLIGSTDDIRNM